MTRRTIVLVVLVIIAAAPLTWMSVDPNAGNKLLSLTNGSKISASSNNYFR